VGANIVLRAAWGLESSGWPQRTPSTVGPLALHECHHLYHGEKVAFGTLTQLVLEKHERGEIDEVMEFCTDVGLPITWASWACARPGRRNWTGA